MAAAMLKQTRMTILLSLNAVAILIAGILIANAIGMVGNGELRVVAERSDDIEEAEEEASLIDPVMDVIEAITGGSGSASSRRLSASASVTPSTSMSFDSGTVPSGELWAKNDVTIYQTANIDLCVSDTLPELGSMYWQTSNSDVVVGFYSEARTRLGYSTDRCRYPKIVGTGTTTITAGTYDGLRRDSITVTVVAPPVDQWKREVLNLVNQQRASNGLSALSWGSTCEGAAQTRAQEIMSNYSHTRPDGSSWSTVCQPPNGGTSGENLAAGNTAVSPETVVQTWMNSESHRANILSDQFTKMAVGFVFDPNSQYKTYWSEFFSTY